jgi:hypothetical protein
MKLLVLTSEPITASQLRDAVSATVDPSNTEVMVVAPALAENPIKFWLSDADDAIQRADRVRAETVRELSEAGVAAGGETGESDPIQAVIDALQTFPADRVVVFTHGNGESGRYREDVDEAEIEERVGLPVDRATLPR